MSEGKKERRESHAKRIAQKLLHANMHKMNGIERWWLKLNG